MGQHGGSYQSLLPIKMEFATAMDHVFVSPQNSSVETPISNVMVLGGGLFGGN